MSAKSGQMAVVDPAVAHRRVPQARRPQAARRASMADPAAATVAGWSSGDSPEIRFPLSSSAVRRCAKGS
jgi:hypothetical protein